MSQFNLKHVIVTLALAVAAGLAQAGPPSDPMPDWQQDQDGWDHGDHRRGDGDWDHGHGQPAAGPIQVVDEKEFKRLIDSGALLPATKRDLQEQERRAFWKDLEHRQIVEEFIRHHPELPRLRELLELKPSNPAVYRTVEGNYRTLLTFPNGFSETIETNGESTKLSQLANSIVTATDPVRQLNLYQSIYSQYAALYGRLCAIPPGQISTVAIGPPSNCANLILPSALTDPATLQNATLVDIHQALTTVGFVGVTALHAVPVTAGAGPVPCNEQVGASTTEGVNTFSGFGDQTQSVGYTTPSSNGIVGNFNFVNKNLLSCIKNQGQRGTCHIFAATSAIEELIARDTGTMVNLSEQDFMENLKLLWAPAYYNDGGDSGFDIQTAAEKGYRFAYEKQWDYNPSLLQPRAPAYEYQETCANYPYPSLEAGCSDSAPQALEYCVSGFFGGGPLCGFLPAPVQGNSPYSAVGANQIWNPTDTDLSVGYIFLALAFNSAVPMCFNETNNFQYGSPGGYIEYSAADNMTNVGGHCVHIVGYVSNEDLAANANTAAATPASGGGYFIIKNSWSASFGDAGYFYMPVDYVKANATSVYAVSSVNH